MSGIDTTGGNTRISFNETMFPGFFIKCRWYVVPVVIRIAICKAFTLTIKTPLYRWDKEFNPQAVHSLENHGQTDADRKFQAALIESAHKIALA